ncbi:hypothetical protein GCK32_020921 [Trichostrongylus colubriformis]|uniref:Uncharacterized protein n=1 Tax=Trichostrongylus colubriformis TaxID=6319 RepID=A0AAN8IQN6_TRICO
MVRTGRMAPFDRGPGSSMKWHGQQNMVFSQTLPVEYDMNHIHSHTYLFYSDYDWLASAVDVEQFLTPALPKTSVKFARILKEFNHDDSLWGLRARKEIYDPITDIIKIDTRRIQEHLQTYFRGKCSLLPSSNFESYVFQQAKRYYCRNLGNLNEGQYHLGLRLTCT